MLESILAPIYENGYSASFYSWINTAAFIVFLAFAFWYGTKFKLKKLHILIISVAMYALMCGWMMVLCWMENGFENFGRKNLIVSFVYIPLIAYPIAKIFKLQWKLVCDFFAPGACILLSLGRWGCIFEGCCRGVECSWGLYNPIIQTIVFPFQIFESVAAAIIALLLILLARQKKYSSNGLSLPIMYILLGSCRFLLEFFTDDEKVLFNFSSSALHALFMMIVGLIALFVIARSNCKTYGEELL
ncbi:MAG: prolipoprotein diacylglyceryl transferase [Clostridia bacterium]|nr:prolipoprotein diacylglyceryl transferase [Clostridia bacterium]